MAVAGRCEYTDPYDKMIVFLSLGSVVYVAPIGKGSQMKLAQFVGQESVKRQLTAMIKVAKDPSRSPPYILDRKSVV